jgi:hypothetical protein
MSLIWSSFHFPSEIDPVSKVVSLRNSPNESNLITESKYNPELFNSRSSNTISQHTSFSTVDIEAIAPTAIYYADFENTTGDNAWTVGTGATDGNWIIGQPSPYVTLGTQMEIASFAGSQNLQTGIVNNQDLDDGPAIAQSPVITLDPNADDIDISFSYYFSHYINSSVDDNMIIQIRNAVNNNVLSTLVTETGSATSKPAQWTSFQQDLTALAGNQIYIYITAQDIGTPSKVEGAIDEIEIIQNVPDNSSLSCDNLITDDFESGFGNWNDGGNDVDRINNNGFANSGNFSIRLRDNNNNPNNTNTSMTSGTYDLSNVDSVEVSFSFITNGFNAGEDFWFQISTDNGANYVTQKTWVLNTDFTNNLRVNENFKLGGPFSTTTLFRFRCDASGNNDQVYIDDVVIERCTITENCPIIALRDTTVCNNGMVTINPSITGGSQVYSSHQWTVLGSSTATGYSLSSLTDRPLTVDADGAIAGTLDLSYMAVDTNGCSDLDTLTIFVLAVNPCIIDTESDSVCGSTTLVLDAQADFSVFPDSGIVVATSGPGISQIHEINGVQDPTNVKVTITVPTWDDHFDSIILNGNMIIPEIMDQVIFRNATGMNCATPWNANVNGLPRSIITIENNQVRYFSSLTTTSTVMTEVFPTNWTTTPQNFVPGFNTLRFGILNQDGPTSGSWFIDVEGIGNYSYLWSTGDTTKNITVTPSMTTSYTVTVTAPNGCESICNKTITVGNPSTQNINYTGCSSDGYSIVVNGTTYNEANPTGTEVLTAAQGCDSTININLTFNPQVIVEAGMPSGPICSNAVVDLTSLGASISGGVSTGQWTTMGNGSFNNGGLFNGATMYTLGQMDKDAGMVILTLTSNDPAGPCEPAADAVMILINDVTCSPFPWAGN